MPTHGYNLRRSFATSSPLSKLASCLTCLPQVLEHKSNGSMCTYGSHTAPMVVTSCCNHDCKYIHIILVTDSAAITRLK